MAKFLLSNDAEKYNYIKNIYVSTGFNKFNEYISKNINFSVYKKLRVDNCNFLKIGDDFIATSGTLIYKNMTGGEALNNIYNDFSGNVQDIRNNIIGNYALIIKKKDKIYIFGDENNIHNIYYYNDKQKWILTNTQFHIAKVLNDIEIDEFNLIQAVFQASILGNGTIFKGIKKLMGDEYITIDLINYEINIKYPDIQVSDIDSMAEDFAGLLKNKIKIISQNFKTITISMTGGLDTRVNLAGFLSNNIKPNLVYGVGNSLLTGTHNRDLEIVKIYAKKFGLNFYEMNWRTNNNIFEYWDKSLLKYGELFEIYGASKNIFREFEEKIDTQFIEFGYFGEPLRNKEWLEKYDKVYFNLNDYLEFYINKYLINTYEKVDDYKENLKEKVRKIVYKYGLNENKIHKDDFQKLYYIYRRSADTKMNNYSNYFFYSISVLSTNDLYNYILNVPYEYKKNAKFMLKVLYYLYPDVLDVPFFSHRCDCIFNKNKFELKYRENFVKKIRNVLSIKINKEVFNLMKKIYLMFPIGIDKKTIDENKDSFKLEKLLLDYIFEKQHKISFIKNLNIWNYTRDMSSLAVLSQMLFMIENIKNNEETLNVQDIKV